MFNSYSIINKKLLSMVILLAILSCNTTDDHTSSSLIATTKQHDAAFSLLGAQIEKVQEYIASLSADQVYLVLGVDNQESDLDQRFNASYIFLNIEHGNEHNPRSLTVDFNKLDQLQYLATNLPETFDKIILDGSTFKYTEWSKEHVESFKLLLKPNGKFIFGPQISTVILSSGPSMPEELVLHKIREETKPEDSKKLITGDFHLPSSNWNLKPIILREIFVPQNYVLILEKVFGEGNVAVEYDKALPFISHFDKIEPILITATRKID